MSFKTALYEQHVALHGKIVDFAGWAMPLNYGSQIEEHLKIRQDAGMFDVSHMMVIDISGSGAKDFLRFLLANDVAKLTVPGKALYSCMLNDTGGVLDDLIVYYRGPENYRLVVNAATCGKDLAWIRLQAQEFQIAINERRDLAIIAIQGPNARNKVNQVLSPKQQQAAKDLTLFQGVECENFWIARTGYTGEDGYEILLPNDSVVKFWCDLIDVGVAPCGLGARDTLRLEAGLNLYGADMDETTTPLESNLEWTIAWAPEERNFIGRVALMQQKQAGVKRILTGLLFTGRGVLRNHQAVVIPNQGEGEITSGSFSPMLGKSIALARIPNSQATECQVQMRNQLFPVKIVKPPFVRNGKVLVEC